MSRFDVFCCFFSKAWSTYTASWNFATKKDAMLNSSVNPDLQDARADRCHWLPISWQKTALHLVQFEPSASPGVNRKGSEFFARLPGKGERLQIPEGIY